MYALQHKKDISVLNDLVLVYSMKLKIKMSCKNQDSYVKFLLSRTLFLDLFRYMNTVTYRSSSTLVFFWLFSYWGISTCLIQGQSFILSHFNIPDSSSTSLYLLVPLVPSCLYFLNFLLLKKAVKKQHTSWVCSMETARDLLFWQNLPLF